jgi:hypothetical protein
VLTVGRGGSMGCDGEAGGLALPRITAFFKFECHCCRCSITPLGALCLLLWTSGSDRSTTGPVSRTVIASRGQVASGGDRVAVSEGLVWHRGSVVAILCATIRQSQRCLSLVLTSALPLWPQRVRVAACTALHAPRRRVSDVTSPLLLLLRCVVLTINNLSLCYCWC